MVYTKLYIITGIVLTKEQVAEFLWNAKTITIGEDDCIEELFTDHIIRDKILSFGNMPIRLYGFPCCSESNREKFILGYVVHTYYRKHIECKECKEYAVCDKCIGETNNGWYDVDAISNGPYIIPREKICNRCGSDRVAKNGRCETCFLVPTVSKGYLEKEVEMFALKILGMSEEKIDTMHYYMVNDCLSCS